MLYLLDTNTVSYYFRGTGNIAGRLLSRSPSDIAIPAVVEYEIRFGLARIGCPQKRIKQLDTFLSVTAVLPFSSNDARAAADLRAALEAKGRQIGPHDVLIAAAALCRAATLVTHNLREFSQVDGLLLDDWY